MSLRDRPDVLFVDHVFVGLYPSDGKPGRSPGQPALVSVLQFAESLSARAAADAVRTRTAWKVAGFGRQADVQGRHGRSECQPRDAADLGT